MSDKSCPHCGGSLESGRSSPDHRRLFGLIRAAFDHWPPDYDFQPMNSEHLRAWLTAKAGHREGTFIEMPDNPSPEVRDMFMKAVEATIAAVHGKGFPVPYKGGICVVTAKSIAWHKLGQREFGKLRDDITDIIEAVIGCKADDLLRERAA